MCRVWIELTPLFGLRLEISFRPEIKLRGFCSQQ
jgi:hypothetical protein